MKNKTQITAIQQGDVILRRVTSLPTGNRLQISKGKLVLAEGEVTGHYHGIAEDDSELVQVGDKTFMLLERDSDLTHQEHHNINVEAGIWEVGRVQEYDYFSKMTKTVVD